MALIPEELTTHFLVLASNMVAFVEPKIRLPLPWSTLVGPAATPEATQSGHTPGFAALTFCATCRICCQFFGSQGILTPALVSMALL